MTEARIIIRPVPFEQTYPLRHAVLWPGKPPSFVRVVEDPDGYHTGAFDGDALVGVISLFVAEGAGRFRKFAVRPDYQRQGIGTRLFRHVLNQARQQGARTLGCDARLDAADFYRTFGLLPDGAVFYKGTVPYVKMSTRLD